MSVKNVLLPFKLADATSLGASFVSASTSIRYLDNVAIQMNASGTPVGDLTVEGTVDGTNWIAFSTASSLTGSSSNFLLDLNQLSFDKVRVRYTRTSGTGSVDIWVMAKRIGG